MKNTDFKNLKGTIGEYAQYIFRNNKTNNKNLRATAVNCKLVWDAIGEEFVKIKPIISTLNATDKLAFNEVKDRINEIGGKIAWGVPL